MKKMIAVLLCVCSLICFAGCSSEIPKNMTSAASENEAFNFYVPKSWAVNTSGGTASAFFSATDRSNVSMTCMLAEEGFSTLKDYTDKAIASYREILPEFDGVVMLPGEEGHSGVKLGGEEAAWMTYTAVLDGVHYKYMQLVCLHGGMFYVFTYTSTVENYDSHADELDQILTYISFK